MQTIEQTFVTIPALQETKLPDIPKDSSLQAEALRLLRIRGWIAALEAIQTEFTEKLPFITRKTQIRLNHKQIDAITNAYQKLRVFLANQGWLEIPENAKLLPVYQLRMNERDEFVYCTTAQPEVQLYPLEIFMHVEDHLGELIGALKKQLSASNLGSLTEEQLALLIVI